MSTGIGQAGCLAVGTGEGRFPPLQSAETTLETIGGVRSVDWTFCRADRSWGPETPFQAGACPTSVRCAADGTARVSGWRADYRRSQVATA